MMNNGYNGYNGYNGQKQNRIDWQQFSDRLREVVANERNDDGGAAEECRFNRKKRDNLDANFADLVEVSTPKRRQSSSISSSSGTIRRRSIVKFQLVASAAVASSDAEVEETTTSRYEVVQKLKTRAARRAIEVEVTTPTVNPSPKRERRSDYWIQQNDKRRNAARAFKMTAAAAME